jgi:hypothetical protein
MSFQALARKGLNLYRGWNGTDKEALVRIVGVGPAREAAYALVHLEPRPNDPLVYDAAEWLMRRVAETTHTPLSSIIGTDPIDRLDRLLSLPNVAANVFTVFEHVVDAPERPNQVNSIYTNRRVESTSQDPRVAIRYAYGIRPDSARPGVPAALSGSVANADPFIAIIELTRETNLELVPSNVAGVDAAETQRRINRDSEVFARKVEKARIVRLPPFAFSDPDGSLDRAADALRTQGVAL